MIIFITVLAPIVEEIVFRKGVYGIVGKISQNFLNNRDMDPKKSHLIANIIAIAISSLIFGAIHAVDVYILIYAGLGVALGTVYYMSNKNVFAAICVHILYNSISIILTLLVF
jgi:membrane protease YdiL (CAAX protease family)